MLSYYKTNASAQNYAGQIPLPVGIEIVGDHQRKQVEVQLIQSDEVDILLRFKLSTKSEWFDWMSHLSCVKRLLVTETRSAAMRTGRSRRNQSVWARDLEQQERLQKEAAAQNAALERRIKELQDEQSKGLSRQQLEKLRKETAQLQEERDRMTDVARQLKSEVEKLKKADESAIELQKEIERLKDALSKGSSEDVVGDSSVLAKQLRAAKNQLRNMQLQMMSGSDGDGVGAQSILFRALMKFQTDGYIYQEEDIKKLEEKYKTLFCDDDWAKLSIDSLYEGLFRKHCSNPLLLREILDAINDVMRENQILNMDLYRLPFWKTTLNKSNFVNMTPDDIKRWAKTKPWPIRMAGGASLKLEDCKIVNPPPKAQPQKSDKDRLFDDIIRVESSFAAQVEKFKAMQQNLVSSLSLLTSLEDEYKTEYGKITGGIKTASTWANQLSKDSYLRRALNREGYGKDIDDVEDEEDDEFDDFVSARELPQFAK